MTNPLTTMVKDAILEVEALNLAEESYGNYRWISETYDDINSVFEDHGCYRTPPKYVD